MHNSGMAKKPAHAKTYTWEISRIKATPAAVLGRVETSDDKPSSAIKAAIERFRDHRSGAAGAAGGAAREMSAHRIGMEDRPIRLQLERAGKPAFQNDGIPHAIASQTRRSASAHVRSSANGSTRQRTSRVRLRLRLKPVVGVARSAGCGGSAGFVSFDRAVQFAPTSLRVERQSCPGSRVQ